MENMAGIAETLINFIMMPHSFKIFKAAVKLTGDIMSSEQIEFCENFLKYGLSSAMTIGWNTYKTSGQTEQEINDERTEIDRLFCWILSNMAANPSPEIILEILNNDYLTHKISTCASSPNIRVAREAIFTITNILTIQDWRTAEFAIFKKGIFELIIPLLSYPE